jgi:predicted transcriptional regulator
MMHIQTAKQDAIAVIQRLPDTADMEEIMYRLYVLENIRRGQEDAEQGKTVPAEHVLKDLQTW